MTTLEDLWSTARVARVALEPGLDRDASGGPVAGGSCLHASVLLLALMHRYGRGTGVVRGGLYGALGADGVWRGHYWVEALVANGGRYVVDITADQFGWRPIEILDVAAASKRYRPGNQAEVDDAARALAQELGMADYLRPSEGLPMKGLSLG